MIRGPFPPGFPGLRLPGLRFHPHFGEAKVLKKQDQFIKNQHFLLVPRFWHIFVLNREKTGWWPVSSGTTTLCSSSWRPGRKFFSRVLSYEFRIFVLFIYLLASTTFMYLLMLLFKIFDAKFIFRTNCRSFLARTHQVLRPFGTFHKTCLGNFYFFSCYISYFTTFIPCNIKCSLPPIHSGHLNETCFGNV